MPGAPLDALSVLAVQEVEVTPTLQHLELFTRQGLLTVLWHGPHDAERVVAACGGAMGGLLGPADGLYHRLGGELGPRGIGMLRVGYRRPNHIGQCTLDLCAAVDLAARRGARTAVTLGHSFGGAVAIRAACALGEPVRGVVTYATQSAGCEEADQLDGRPLLLLHGDADELLPVAASEAVRFIAGSGDLVVLPGEGHLLTGAGDELLERTLAFVEAALA
jgi:alpha/beta superfamily hydrolase